MIIDTKGRPVVIDIATAYTAGVQGVGVSTLGNTAGNTGTSSGVIVLAGSNNVTLSQSSNTAGNTVWIQLTGAGAADGVNILSASGNTAGTLGTQSTGTVVLAGGANITLSQSSNSISIVGGAGAGGAALSAGTQSQNTGTVIFSNASGVSFGLNAGTLTASVKTDYLTTAAASNHSHGNPTLNLTNLSGTTASNSAGLTLSLSAGNYLTTAALSNHSHGNPTLNLTNLSGTTASNSAGLTLSLSAGNYLTTAAASDHSHGNPTLALTNLSGTTASNSAGLTLSLSAAAPGAGGGIAASLSGNSTSGGAGYSNVTSGTLILAGGNNITLSQDGSRVTISGANLGGAQTGISGIGASDTTYSSGTVIWSGQNNITVGTSVNGASQYVRLSVGNYITTAAQSNQVVNSLNGSTGQVSLATGSSLSSSQNGSTITFGLASNITTALQSAGAYLTTAAQSNQVVNSLNGSTGQISLATGSSLSSSSNGSTITFGLASNITTALQSANANYLTSQSNQAVSGSNASSTFQTVTFGNSNGMSFYLTNGSMVGSYTVPTVPTAYVSSVNGSSGAISFATGSSLSSSQNGSTVTWGLASNITTALQSAGAYLTTAAASNHSHSLHEIQDPTADKVFNLGTRHLQFAFAGGGTFSTNATRQGLFEIDGNVALTDNADIVHIHNTVPSAQVDVVHIIGEGTGALPLKLSAGGAKAIELNAPISFTGGSVPLILGTSQSNSVANLNANYLQGKQSSEFQSTGNYITTARASNDAIGLNTAATNVTWTVNSSGLSLNAGGYAGTGTSATNASITLNTNGLAISVAAPGAALENNWINLSGNTAGNTTASGSTIKWYGGANITLHGTNGSEVSIIGGAGGGGAAIGVSNTGHTAGNTGTYSSGTIVFAGSSSLTLSQSTGGGGVHTIWLQPAMSQLTAGDLISLSSNGSTVSVINLLSSSGIAQAVGSVSSAGTLSSRFALADHIHAGVAAWGASNTGNTAGNTGTRQGTWVLAGSNSITISASSGGAGVHTLWVQQTGGGGGIAAGVSNTGNTAGNTGTYSSGTIVFAGSNSLTLSQSTGGGGVHTIWLQPLNSALSGGGGISLSTTGSTIVIYTV